MTLQDDFWRDRRVFITGGTGLVGAWTTWALVERGAHVFHLAAQTIVGIANRCPLSTFETNIKGTWCLLEAARRCGSRPDVVVASSDKAYGEQPELPYTEESPLA